MSWGVKNTCFKAPGVSLGGSGVSIGGVRILRVRWFYICLLLGSGGVWIFIGSFKRYTSRFVWFESCELIDSTWFVRSFSWNQVATGYWSLDVEEFIYIYISCSSLPWGNWSNLTYIFSDGLKSPTLENEDSGKKKTTKRAINRSIPRKYIYIYANLRLHMGGFLSWNRVPQGRSLGRKVVQLSFPLLHLCTCSITMTGRWHLKMVIGGNTTIWDQNQTQATCHLFEHPSLKEDCIVILKEQFKIFKSIFLKKFVRDRYTIIPSPPSS